MLFLEEMGVPLSWLERQWVGREALSSSLPPLTTIVDAEGGAKVCEAKKVEWERETLAEADRGQRKPDDWLIFDPILGVRRASDGRREGREGIQQGAVGRARASLPRRPSLG